MSGFTIGGVTREVSARADASRPGVFIVSLDGETLEVHAERDPEGRWRIVMPDGTSQRVAVSRDGTRRWVQGMGRAFVAEEASEAAGATEEEAGLEAPMPGKVWKVLVAPGDVVESGQTLMIIEAMKMEHAIKAPRAGIVREVRAEAEAMVEPGSALVVLDHDVLEGEAE